MIAQSPQEVLEAVRRLESDLEAMRARTRDRDRDLSRDLSDLRNQIAGDAARERQSVVEDMERMVELIGASWRATHDQITALSGQVATLADEVAGLRHMADETLGGLRDGRVELRLAASNGVLTNGNGHGAAAPTNGASGRH